MPLLKNTLTTTVGKGAVVAAAAGLLVPMLSACGETRNTQLFCQVIEDHQETFDAAANTVGFGELRTDVSEFQDAFASLEDMWPELAKVAPEPVMYDVDTVNEVFGADAPEDDTDENTIEAASNITDYARTEC